VRILVVAIALASLPAHALKKAKKPPPPAAELVALNTHEIFKLRPGPNGHFGPKQLHGWNRFLRCHHTGRVHQMAARLAELLYKTSEHFEWKKILVVAGYRAPRVAREKGNPKSPHKKGVACDFYVDGIENTQLRDFVRAAFDKIGVGYYPNSGFVHLDVGRKWSAFWIDYSKPGERAKYSKNPEGDLASENAEDAPEVPEAIAQEPAPQAPETAGGVEPQKNSSPGATAPNPLPPPPPTTQNN
jgi:uncharacterized protein YcbK (DUF882 family)